MRRDETTLRYLSVGLVRLDHPRRITYLSSTFTSSLSSASSGYPPWRMRLRRRDAGESGLSSFEQATTALLLYFYFYLTPPVLSVWRVHSIAHNILLNVSVDQQHTQNTTVTPCIDCIDPIFHTLLQIVDTEHNCAVSCRVVAGWPPLPPFRRTKSHLFLIWTSLPCLRHPDHKSGCWSGTGGLTTEALLPTLFCSFETQPFSRLRVVEIPISAVVVAHLLAGEDGSSIGRERRDTPCYLEEET